MTMTLTYDATLARVEIALTGMVDGDVTVERSLNGILWDTVRGGVEIAVQAGMATLYDYEFAPDVENYYRVTHLDAGLVLPGIAGAYVDTPDHGSLDVTGDFEIRAEVTPAVWPVPGLPSIVSKYVTSGDQRSYRMRLFNGALSITWSPTGTSGAAINATSTALIPGAQGERIALRAVLDADNDNGGWTATFYTSDSIGGPWTILGDPVTGVGPTNVFVSTAVLEVGTVAAGTLEPFAGTVHAVEVRDGIDFPYPQALKLNRAASTYASTPDTAALDIVGDLDLRAEVIIDDWTPAAIGTLIAKFGLTGNQRSYQLQLATDGTLILQWSADGTAVLSATSTAPVPGHAGTPMGVRATLDVNNGAAGRTVTFYYSFDFVTWIPLGTAVTTAGVTSIFASTAVLAIGARVTDTANLLLGKVLRAEVRNGIAGTVVAAPDFRTGWVDGDNASTPARADSTGKLWTLSGEAVIIGDAVVANPDFGAQPQGTTTFADAAGRTWTLHGTAVLTGDSETETITPDFGDRVWLKSIAYPFLNRAFDAGNVEVITREFRGTIHSVQSRSLPVAVTDLRGGRSWTITLVTRTLEDARDMDLVLAANTVMFLQPPREVSGECGPKVKAVPGGYVAVMQTGQARTMPGGKAYIWTLACQEVAAPAPDVVGTTMTWRTVLRLYGTAQAMMASNPTWLDVYALVGSPDDLVAL